MKDNNGRSTLEAFSKANLFNKWLFNQVFHELRGHVLEVGSGIGNLSELFIQKNTVITLSDIDQEYCSILEQRFKTVENCRGIFNLDLTDPDFDKNFVNLFGTFDSVVALNVIEHIEDDNLVFLNVKKLLKPDGRFIVLVPAFKFLFNSLDRKLLHFRRYSAKELKLKYQNCGYKVLSIHYFNMPAIFGWFLAGSIFRLEKIPENSLNLYNLLVPFLRGIDFFFKKILGISLIAVGQLK